MTTDTMEKRTTKKQEADSPQYEKTSKEKFAIRCIAGLILGGFLGGACAAGSDLLKDSVSETVQNIIQKIPFVQVHVLPWILLVFIIISTIIGVSFIKKAKILIDSWDGEDDEHIAKADSFLNKASSNSSIQIIITQMLFALMTYNLMDNLQNKADAIMILVGVAIYFISLFITVTQQNRIIKLIKEYAPEKKGSVYDKNFQDVWLASCDEAEQLMIYKASHKTYAFMNKVFSCFLVIAVIAGMFVSIGMLCAFLIGLLWLIMICCYTKEVEKLEHGSN